MGIEEPRQQLIDQWRKDFAFNEILIEAFSKVKRENFIPKDLYEHAYDDTPLPLMRNKTISQPTTVMVMTAALDAHEGDRVLEIGAGSGYQAAIISHLVGKEGHVVTTEIIPELVHMAREHLSNAGITNVEVLEEDGSRGVPEKGPYDRIIVTAACAHLPEPLIDNLNEGGVMVAPVGDRYHQEMVVATKRADGVDKKFLGSFIFTPLYGNYGFEV